MGDQDAVQVVLPEAEFEQEVEERLGRANGNIYHRRPGIEGLHDGQIMVRLKKKRYIIIDYGIIPNEADMQAAVLDTHIHIPDGAGRQQCSTPDCTKVGVPVLIYDSNPGETQSLYLRAGLCFTCQRNLNEKRRCQRKRKRDIVAETNPNPPFSHTVAQKKFKVGSDVIELSPEAIIVNGPVQDAKHYGEGYGYPEIGTDLQNSLLEAAAATQSLVAAVATNSTDGADPTAVAFSSAVAAARDNGIQTGEAAGSNVSSEDISSLYEKAFMSMSKGMFLLSQWKASWDSAVAAAVAQETVNEAGLADAVASATAAAVVAAAEGQDQSMIPLILAAESKEAEKKEEESGEGEVFSV